MLELEVKELSEKDRQRMRKLCTYIQYMFDYNNFNEGIIDEYLCNIISSYDDKEYTIKNLIDDMNQETLSNDFVNLTNKKKKKLFKYLSENSKYNYTDFEERYMN